MKRGAKIIVVLLAVLLLCSCVSCKKEDDGSFYVKKNGDTGSSNTLPRYILDVSYKQEQVNIPEIPNIPFSVGVGHSPVGKNEEYQAWIIVTAEGCSINGEEDVFRQDYEDFFLNDVYTYIKGERIFFGLGTLLYPQYYESVEISFPQQDCSGTVSIELFSTKHLSVNGGAVVTLTFQYTIKNGVLTLIEK